MDPDDPIDLLYQAHRALDDLDEADMPLAINRIHHLLTQAESALLAQFGKQAKPNNPSGSPDDRARADLRPADLLHLAAGAAADMCLDQAAIYLDIARLMVDGQRHVGLVQLDHNIHTLGGDS